MAEWTFGETLLVARTVGDALESMPAEWYVGGSVASSLHGIPRATQDVDIVATLRPGHGRRLAAILGPDFYISAEAAETAIGARRSFNVIHLETMFKVDLFTLKDEPYGRRAMARRLVRVVAEGGISIPVATAEDTIAHKLYWYRLTDETSEKQWRDLMGVVKAVGAELNLDALHEAATDLGVDDLVERALREGSEP